MGTIQSSINHLMGTAWGSLASLAIGAKKSGILGAKEPQAQRPNVKQPQVESRKAKIPFELKGKQFNTNVKMVSRSTYAKAASVQSANNMIDEKAASKTFNVADRIKLATSLSVIDKGGK